MKIYNLSLLVIAVMLSASVYAQATPADLADAWLVVVKDGQSEQFNSALKDHMKHRARKGDTREWKTYAPVVGDDLNHYIIRYCCSTYAEMDDYSDWSQKTKMNTHWNENVDPHVAEYSHYFYRTDFANSNWPDEEPGFKMFGVTSWQPKSGQTGAIERSKAAMSKAAKDNNWPRNWSWSNRIGGEDQLMLVTPYMDYADMQGPAGGFGAFLIKHLGEDAATKMLGGFSNNFHGSTYSIYRLVDDLSMSSE